MNEVLEFAGKYPSPTSAETALELGQAMLKAAFTSPYGSNATGGDLLDEAFRLGRKSLVL